MSGMTSNWYQDFIDRAAILLAHNPEMENEVDNLLVTLPTPFRGNIKQIIVNRANQYMEQGGGAVI